MKLISVIKNCEMMLLVLMYILAFNDHVLIINFIDENEESSERTSFLKKLKATRIANINKLLVT